MSNNLKKAHSRADHHEIDRDLHNRKVY